MPLHPNTIHQKELFEEYEKLDSDEQEEAYLSYNIEYRGYDASDCKDCGIVSYAVSCERCNGRSVICAECWTKCKT